MDQSHVDEEVELLRQKIVEFGTPQENGAVGISFGELYEKTVDILEVYELSYCVNNVFIK